MKMEKVAVITDSNSGITQSEAKDLGIRVVPMPFFVNGETFYEDISMNQQEFYDYLSQGAEVMTSQPSPETLTKLWDEVLEEYEEIVYIPMSSGLSSSCGTAMMLSYEEEYENKVFVVDNQRISVTQRRSVLDALELVEKGYNAAKIQWIRCLTSRRADAVRRLRLPLVLFSGLSRCCRFRAKSWMPMRR